MRIWFDTEFLENGRSIRLISIGAVREDGECYYAETTQSRQLANSDPWLKAKVLPHLSLPPDQWKGLSRIASDMFDFAGESPEFWAYYAAYDWVVLCQLFGRMIDLPPNWPMFCRDVQQIADPALKPPKDPNEHHALADARWTKQYWENLNQGALTLGG